MNTSYTSSKFAMLKGDCPVCNGERKDCRSSGELIHCFSHLDAPLGYEFKKLSGIGASLYAPKKEQFFAQRNSIFSSTRIVTSKAINQDHPHPHPTSINKLKGEGDPDLLPTIEERDRMVRGNPQKLSIVQNADLLRRGLTQDEIDFAISKHWLFGLQGGYGIAAYDPISQLLCGAQRANDDRTKKYTWGVFTGKNKLKETGENPLFVWQSPDFDSSKPYETKFSEGALKPLVRAFQEWRTNPQVIVIGAAGGIFVGKYGKGLERVLSAYPDATSYTLLPDADTQNEKKLNIYSGYRKASEAIPSLKFAEWGHWQATKEQDGKDCDETYSTDAFNGYELRSPDDWLNFFVYLKAKQEYEKHFAVWQSSKEFSPDVRLNSQAVFDGIPIPDVNSIIAIKSDFGTQKTRGMLPHLKHWDKQGYKVILGGYRNALLTQTINVWSEVLSNFMLMKTDTTCIRMAGQHIAACLDQFTKNKCQPYDFDKSILVIDEADAVELHLLMGGTLKDKRSEVYGLFCESVKRADVIYLMSAGLTDATVKFIAGIRSDRTTKITKYGNDFVNKQRFTIVDDVFVDENTSISGRSILRSYATYFKSRSCVVSDSQIELEALEKERQGQGRKTFRYDSKTSDTEDGKAFALEPVEFIKLNDIDDLYISPSGNSGISIAIENYFDAVFAFPFGVLDVDSFLQMPMRVRDKSVKRYIAPPESVGSGENKPKMPEEVMALTNDFVNDFGLLCIQGLPVQDRLEEFYKQISDFALNNLQFKRYAEIQAAQNFEKENFKMCLEWRLADLGHKFNNWDDGESNSETIEQILINKEEIKLEECQKIESSDDITLHEAKKILDLDKPYEERLKAHRAIITKEYLPNIDKSALWCDRFLKLTRFDDRELLKTLDLRHLANNPDIAKFKAVDSLAYLVKLSGTVTPQDMRSPLRFLTAAKDIGLLDLMNYKGAGLHKSHRKIINICNSAKVKTNANRLGLFQGKKESHMQFVARLLEKLGYGIEGRYIKVQKKRFYEIKDTSRATIEIFQTNRAMNILGAKLQDLPPHLYAKCFEDDEQKIFNLAEYCDKFGIQDMLKICYGKAENLRQLTLIDLQLQLLFASVDGAFLELSEAINNRYRNYESNKKEHDFEQIMDEKNSTIASSEIITESEIEVDHPQPTSINKLRGEGDPDLSPKNTVLDTVQILPVTTHMGNAIAPTVLSPLPNLSSPPTRSSKNLQPKIGDRVRYVGQRFSAAYGGFEMIVNSISNAEIDCTLPDGRYTTKFKTYDRDLELIA